jgi:hypothetical protein
VIVRLSHSAEVALVTVLLGHRPSAADAGAWDELVAAGYVSGVPEEPYLSRMGEAAARQILDHYL